MVIFHGYMLNNQIIAIENDPVEIVDLPIDSMVDLSIANYVSLPEGISIKFYKHQFVWNGFQNKKW